MGQLLGPGRDVEQRQRKVVVLYAVAAAVIGGIYNGMYRQGLAVQYQFLVTGAMLVAAMTIDALSRRGATSGSVTRI